MNLSIFFTVVFLCPFDLLDIRIRYIYALFQCLFIRFGRSLARSLANAIDNRIATKYNVLIIAATSELVPFHFDECVPVLLMVLIMLTVIFVFFYKFLHCWLPTKN